MSQQLLGGNVALPGNMNVVWSTLFEGNPQERGGREGAENHDPAQSSLYLTVNKSIANFGVGAITDLIPQIRVTWGAGRGGASTNQAIVDVGPGGTCVNIGCTNYLKVEASHMVRGSNAPAQYDLSWVRSYGGQKMPAYCTSFLGPIPAGTRCGRIAVPSYAARGRLSSDLQPNFGDSIGFYRDPGPGLIFSDQYGFFWPAAVPCGGEFFDVSNTGALAIYQVVWELRL